MKPLLDVLIILDALEKEGSFAAASAKLYKTPSALSYTVQKLEMWGGDHFYIERETQENRCEPCSVRD